MSSPLLNFLLMESHSRCSSVCGFCSLGLRDAPLAMQVVRLLCCSLPLSGVSTLVPGCPQRKEPTISTWAPGFEFTLLRSFDNFKAADIFFRWFKTCLLHPKALSPRARRVTDETISKQHGKDIVQPQVPGPRSLWVREKGAPWGRAQHR